MAEIAEFSQSTTLSDIIRARRNDKAVINSLKSDKLSGRDLTGTITAPPTVENSHRVGDRFVSGSDLWVFMDDGTRKWMKFTADAVVT